MIVDKLEHPIVQAPMAGGPSTCALAAAVSNAGGLGFLAAGYRSADALRSEIQTVRAATRSPFGVNLFVPGVPSGAARELEHFLATLAAEEERYGVGLGVARYSDDAWSEKLSVLAEEPVAVVSFTFGCPAPAVVDSLRAVGTEVWVTVSSPSEARLADEAGADVLVVQGAEAGGHRASFVDSDDVEIFGLLPLLQLVRARSSLPLVAAGGIGDGFSLAAVLVAGAVSGQLGTVFLRCPEAATNEAHRRALAQPTATRLTRAFTGRLARGLANRFLLEHSADAPLAYPEIHYATAPIREAARRLGDADGFNLWAGEAHAAGSDRPAAEIVRMISAEARRAVRQASERVGGSTAGAA